MKKVFLALIIIGTLTFSSFAWAESSTVNTAGVASPAASATVQSSVSTDQSISGSQPDIQDLENSLQPGEDSQEIGQPDENDQETDQPDTNLIDNQNTDQDGEDEQSVDSQDSEQGDQSEQSVDGQDSEQNDQVSQDKQDVDNDSKDKQDDLSKIENKVAQLEDNGDIEDAITNFDQVIAKDYTNENLEKLKELYKKEHDDDIKVYIEGKKANFDIKPFIQDGRTMVAIRQIAEALGAKVDWDDETKTVTITKDDKVIQLTLDSDIAKVNSEDIKIDVPATIKDGRTIVPLRFVSEALDSIVNWDDATKLITIVPQQSADTSTSSSSTTPAAINIDPSTSTSTSTPIN